MDSGTVACPLPCRNGTISPHARKRSDYFKKRSGHFDKRSGHFEEDTRTMPCPIGNSAGHQLSLPGVRRPQRAVFLVLVGALSLGALLTGSTGRGWAAPARSLDTKPEDPTFVPAGTVFDCEGRDTIALSAGFSVSVQDSTTGTGTIGGYSCRQWNEAGPEKIFILETAGPIELFAALRDLEDRDLDLFLLSDCDSDSCLVGANVEFTLTLAPGTYFLVVDGYAQPVPQAGAFTLLLECREPGLPAQVCTGEAATPVSCQTGTATLSGDLALEPNLLQSSACSPFLERAGDRWYAVTVAAYHEFTAQLTAVAEGMDAALWLFASCGLEAECLAFADDQIAGLSESLTWANATYLDTTVYLGVDAFVPLPAEGDGVYTLEIRCQAMVPAQKSSLGSVRALFR